MNRARAAAVIALVTGVCACGGPSPVEPSGIDGHTYGSGNSAVIPETQTATAISAMAVPPRQAGGHTYGSGN